MVSTGTKTELAKTNGKTHKIWKMATWTVSESLSSKPMTALIQLKEYANTTTKRSDATKLISPSWNLKPSKNPTPDIRVITKMFLTESARVLPANTCIARYRKTSKAVNYTLT